MDKPRPAGDNRSLQLGSFNKGTTRKQKGSFQVALAALSKHVGVFGEDAAQRTHLSVHLLKLLKAEGVPFLVIEPRKTRYRQLLKDDQFKGHLTVYMVGEHGAFAINPLEVLVGVRLDNHLSNLVELFCRLYSLNDFTVLILQKALTQAYERRGWNFTTGRNTRVPEINLYEPEIQPTLPELLEEIDRARDGADIEPGLKAQAAATLKSIIEPLIAGGKHCVFGMRSNVSITSLLENSAVLELKNLGGDRERAFLIATLFCFLKEHAEQLGENSTLHHALILTDFDRLERFFQTTVAPQSKFWLSSRLRDFTDLGQSVLVVGASADALMENQVKKFGLNLLTKDQDLDELRELADWLKVESATISQVPVLEDGEAMIVSSTHLEPIKVELANSNGSAYSLGAADSMVSDDAVRQGREFLGPFIGPHFSMGAMYAPEAFHLDAYMLGQKVANHPQFYRTFIRYVISVVSDISQLVSFRANVIQVVHTVTGRSQTVPAHIICWCALSLASDRYFADKAQEYDWSLSDLNKLKNVWFSMLAPAFLPSMPNRKLEAGIIRAWVSDYTGMHKRNAPLPMPACAACTSQCLFRHDVAALIDPELRMDFDQMLAADKQHEAVADLARATSEELSGKFNVDLAHCLATTLVNEQDIPSEQHLAFMKSVRQTLLAEA